MLPDATPDMPRAVDEGRPDRGRRTATVALVPVLASTVALAVYLAVGRLVEATVQPAPDVIDLRPAVALLLGAGGAAVVVWAIGLGVVVRALFPAEHRRRVWWRLVGAGSAALVLGNWAMVWVLQVPFAGAAWLLQQAVLALVVVRADRHAAGR